VQKELTSYVLIRMETYHLWWCVRLSSLDMPSRFWYQFSISIHNIFALVRRWLLIYVCSCICVYKRSSAQINTCDRRTKINLWNRKFCYDFIFNVQISDSHISSGFAVILWSLKDRLLHMDLRLLSCMAFPFTKADDARLCSKFICDVNILTRPRPLPPTPVPLLNHPVIRQCSTFIDHNLSLHKWSKHTEHNIVMLKFSSCVSAARTTY
jgi:hypothetical protein